MTNWKEWKLPEVYSVDKDTLVQVKFSDGILGEPNTLQNWMNLIHAPAPIEAFRVWEEKE